MQRGLMQPSRRPFTPHLTLAKVPPASPRLRQAQGEREVAVWWGRGAGDLVGVGCASATDADILDAAAFTRSPGKTRTLTYTNHRNNQICSSFHAAPRDVPAEAYSANMGATYGPILLSQLQLCAMRGRLPGCYYPTLFELSLDGA